VLTTIHILLSYKCTLRCRHCYIYSGPRAKGVITTGQIGQILQEAKKINSVKWIFLNGGEPFMRFPQLLKCIKKIVQLDFLAGIETNGYFAQTEDSALRFLRPLVHLGVSELRISNDIYHYKSPSTTPAQNALKASCDLGLPVSQIRVCASINQNKTQSEPNPSTPVIDRALRYQGRASETLVSGMPLSKWDTFTRCPLDGLGSPDQVYIDAYGNVQICPGINIGNAWETPLAELLPAYRVADHPIYGPISQGGPAMLSEELGFVHGVGYVDACHLCYTIRQQVRAKFEVYLGPPQVYGLEKS
jgi:hypothetical protein